MLLKPKYAGFFSFEYGDKKMQFEHFGPNLIGIRQLFRGTYRAPNKNGVKSVVFRAYEAKIGYNSS